MNTAELAENLAKTAHPIRVIHPPLVRTGFWLLISLAVVVLFAAKHGFRSDLPDQIRNASFVVGFAASFLTGVLGTFGCLMASLPDRSRYWLLLPLPALAAWMTLIGHGCLTDWVSYDAGSFRLGSAFRCLATVLLISLPSAASLFVMLRHAARLRPSLVMVVAGLAVAGMTSTAMSLLYRVDTTVMNLALNLGATALIVAVEAAVAGRFLSKAADWT